MKNLFTVLVFVFSATLLQAQSKYIKGKLTHMDSPLVNAEIVVANSETKVKSGLDGAYTISAEIGDVIQYSYPGLETVEIIVEDVTSILNVNLNQKITELNEVVVKGSNRKSQQDLEVEYHYNKKLIRTAWGILDSETAAGKMRFLEKDDINAVGVCILDLLRNQFAGVKVNGDCQRGGFVTIRGAASLTFNSGAIFDVDGQIFTDAPLWILPSAIERVAVLSSQSLATRYGSIASGGVIVINTNAGNYNVAANKLLDRARLRNNIYQDDAIATGIASKNLPTYLTDLQNSADIAAAQEVFVKNKKRYGNSANYFIDAYAYFTAKGEVKFANKIIKEQSFLFEDHPVHAKALAYHLEANGEIEMAKDLYEQVFIMRPSYAQSYRDLAESYRTTGNYRKSAAMYARHNYLLDEGFLVADTIGISPILERESENLLALEGDKVMDGGKTKNRSAKFTEFDGTRLLFEWNDGEAEFDLQFVNPENHYYTWKHTMEANALRIKDEKSKGYSCEEFLVDGSLTGRWKVNVNYKGNKKLEPTYLKVTTYYNYGEVSQRKVVNVYRLGLKNVNQELFTIANHNLTSN